MRAHNEHRLEATDRAAGRLRLECAGGYTDMAGEWLTTQCHGWGLDDATTFKLQLCMSEVLNNILRHTPEGKGGDHVLLVCARHPSPCLPANHQADRSSTAPCISLTVAHQAPAFTPPAPDHRAALSDESGRGWQILRAWLDDVSYRHRLGVNRLVLFITP
ncbi:ATP-binding protein [Onishia taeanensis]